MEDILTEYERERETERVYVYACVSNTISNLYEICIYR